MRNVLHAKFGDQLAKQSRPSDKVPGISPNPQLPSNSVEDFEGALTKARAAWRASEDQPGRLFAISGSRGVHRRSVCR
jgi:hypothetical protein